MALTPNNQIEAILAGEDIPVSSRQLAFLKEAIRNGGGSGETFETVAEIAVGEMEQKGSIFIYVIDDVTPPTINTTETYYLNNASNPSTIVLNEDGVQAIAFNCDSIEDFSPLDEDKPILVVSWVDGECNIGSNNKDSFSNTTVKILKKVSSGGALPENVKPTYEFDFDASISDDQITFTPAEGVTYAAIAAAIAETPNVKARITLSTALGATFTANFNLSISGDDGVAYAANVVFILGSDPVAIRLSVGEDEGQTVCIGLMKTLAVASA